MAHQAHHDAERVRPVTGDHPFERPDLDPGPDAPAARGNGAGAGITVTGAASNGAVRRADGAANGAPAGPAGSAAEVVDPAEEDAYWRETFVSRPYTDVTLGYDQYRPAYRYGWESRTRHVSRRWSEVERELELGWRENRGNSRLGWGDAKLAARDAWQRVDRRLLDQRELERQLQEQNGS